MKKNYAKLRAKLTGLGYGPDIIDRLDPYIEWDDEGNPHIDPSILSRITTELVGEMEYREDPEVAERIKKQQEKKNK